MNFLNDRCFATLPIRDLCAEYMFFTEEYSNQIPTKIRKMKTMQQIEQTNKEIEHEKKCKQMVNRAQLVCILLRWVICSYFKTCTVLVWVIRAVIVQEVREWRVQSSGGSVSVDPPIQAELVLLAAESCTKFLVFFFPKHTIWKINGYLDFFLKYVTRNDKWCKILSE